MDGPPHVSGNDAGDRRARRTQKALLEAFSSLVQQRRYERIRVADILDGADVGRSTFYEHYRGKDDLLLQSLSGILDVLADATLEGGDDAVLVRILEHFAERGDAARALFSGASNAPVRSRIARELASRIEVRVVRRAGGEPQRARAPGIGKALAEAQLTFVGEWLRDPARCDARDLAAALRRGSAGFVDGILSGPKAR